MNDLKMETEYFKWLCDKVPSDFGTKSYQKLLWQLYLEEFTYKGDMDANRAVQGACLRQEYADCRCLGDYWMAEFPCSVLEMMVALARIIEDRIMKDPEQGDQTGRWFWEMIASMDLMHMDDDHFKESVVHKKVRIMLEHTYASDGHGGLFTVNNAAIDLRELDIWYQAQVYLSNFMHQTSPLLKQKGE